MNVSQLMHTPYAVLSKKDTLKTAVRYMLQHNVHFFPIVENKKLIGSVSSSSILKKLYPTQREIMEEGLHFDFETMEDNLLSLLKENVVAVMKPLVRGHILRPDSSIMYALTMMKKYNLSYLPIANKSDELIGIISQDRIFRFITGSEVPNGRQDDFRNWNAAFFDIMSHQQRDYSVETECLTEIFKKHNVQNVVDVASGTGQNSIQIAKKGFSVTGIDQSIIPHKIAIRKKLKLPKSTQENLRFTYTHSYVDALAKMPESFDAALLLGNILTYYSDDWKKILKATIHSVAPKGVLIMTFLNMELIEKDQNGLIESFIAPSKLSPTRSYSFTRFLDQKGTSKDTVNIIDSILQFNGRLWTHESIHQTEIADVQPETIMKECTKNHMSKVQLFGFVRGEKIASEKFNKDKHTSFTIVASK